MTQLAHVIDIVDRCALKIPAEYQGKAVLSVHSPVNGVSSVVHY